MHRTHVRNVDTNGKCEVAPAAAWGMLRLSSTWSVFSSSMRRLWLRRAANRSRYESEASLREDLPYDELLALSVLGISVTLQRLELQDAVHGWLTTRSDATLHPMVVCLQERVLENLGIFLPLEIQSAWLEEA